ncbi:TonB-dependent receptor [Chryseolinea sp. T2]|uniref:TonB-dependent receptor domain-containing protein n=1 Tax=Chryseolinea sp. T2 TaxID=3129255 RepID=UPI003077C432
MRSIVLTAALTCCTWIAFAQFSLKGQVSNGIEYLPGVNVMLYGDSTLIFATTTDSIGRYILKVVNTGSYRMACSLIGYNSFASLIAIDGSHHQLDVAEIVMSESAVELGEIEITANRSAIDQQLNRLVIRPQDAITQSGNSVLEVLQKSPGVLINKQTGLISVNGRSGARILINDKAVQVSPEVALQMLDGMNSAQIESIELIAVPSAAHDAEGAAGVINITTKKESELGTNGSMTATAGAHWAETLGFSGNINRRTRNIAYFLDYSILRDHNQHMLRMYRETHAGDLLMTSSDDSPRENITTQQNLRGGIEWHAGKRWTFNAQATGYLRDWALEAASHNVTTFNIDSINQTTLNITESNVWKSATGSIGVQYQLNATRHINVSLDYLYYQNNNPSNYTADKADAEEIELSKRTPIKFVVGTAQYVSSLKDNPFSWDAGVKAVLSSFENRVDVQRLTHGEWNDDKQFSSHSTVKEYILAAYVSTVLKAGNQWEVNTGLRYEYTHTDIAIGSDQQMFRRYGNLFPQLSVRKHLPEHGELYFSYSRRISRPTYNDMAPYVFFWSATSFSSGNTFLMPALSDNISAGLQLGSWNWLGLYSHTDNAIAQMQPQIIDKTTSLVLRAQNLDALNTFSLSTSCNHSLFTWWDVRGEFIAQYQRASTSNQPVPVDRSQWGLNLNVRSSVKLPHEIIFEVSLMYQSRSLSGISDFLPYGSLDAAIAKRIGRSSSLKFAIDDILNTNNWYIRTSSAENNLNVSMDYLWNNRFVRLSYTWNFGNRKIASIKSMQASDEERKRVN